MIHVGSATFSSASFTSAVPLSAQYCACLEDLVKAVKDVFSRIIEKIVSIFTSFMNNHFGSRATSPFSKNVDGNQEWKQNFGAEDFKLFSEDPKFLSLRQGIENETCRGEGKLDPTCEVEIKHLFPGATCSERGLPYVDNMMGIFFGGQVQDRYIAFIQDFLSFSYGFDVDFDKSEVDFISIDLDRFKTAKSNSPRVPLCDSEIMTDNDQQSSEEVSKPDYSRSWLRPGSEHVQRFTRIIESLVAFGCQRQAKLLVDHLIVLQTTLESEEISGVITDELIQQWLGLVSIQPQEPADSEGKEGKIE
jgi:hypothetical protein